MPAYAEAMKQVGLANHMPAIDLPATRRALVESRGVKASAGRANQTGDNTCCNAGDAAAKARLVVPEWPATDSTLASHLRQQD